MELRETQTEIRLVLPYCDHCQVAISCTESTTVPSIMGSGATGHISLGIETFGVTGMLSASSKSSGLEEIEQVAFLGGMAHEYVLGAVVGVGGLAATRNFWDTVLVLEPWNVE